MEFQTLYKKDAKGSVRSWKIKVTGNLIEVEHGLEDGKKTKTTELIKDGKNIGRKNSTTPEEQAYSEAQSKWTKKKDSGYSTVLNSNIVDLRPMLAQEYKKYKKDIKFPVYLQPKLDGYRCIYNGFTGKIYSRTGKEYTILENTELHKELQKFKDIILDGELYTHDKDFSFESYGVLRKKKLAKGDDKLLDKILYNVYDSISEETFETRIKNLEQLLKNTKKVKLVETIIALDDKFLQNYNKDIVKLGYEGTMIRNPTSLYSHFRTKDLLKYKVFDDSEFQVVNYEKESDTKGDGAEPVVWLVQTTDGKTFKVPSKGTREERTKLYKNGKNYLGKMLTVQYFGLTNDGIPRFPKTLREGASSFRKDI